MTSYFEADSREAIGLVHYFSDKQLRALLTKMQTETLAPVFKKSSLTQQQPGAKKRLWKSLKQILATERLLPWPEDAITCELSFLCLRV